MPNDNAHSRTNRDGSDMNASNNNQLEKKGVRRVEDPWRAIWCAHDDASATWSVISTIWQRMPCLLKACMCLGSAIFIGGGAAFAFGYMHQDNYAWWALLVMGTSQIALQYAFDKMKGALSREFRSNEVAYRPPETKRHTETRYLMFRRGLIDAEVEPAEAVDCMDLVDVQIDMASTELPQKKVMAFSLAMVTAILAVIWKSQTPAMLVQIMIAILMTGWVIANAMSLFPSHLERMKEMKYFMLLYSRKGARDSPP